MVTITIPEFWLWVVAAAMLISLVLTAVSVWCRWNLMRFERLLHEAQAKSFADMVRTTTRGGLT